MRVVIVDDEPLARQRIETLLRNRQDIQIVGQGANGEQALKVIADQQPDLVFLDIQMPGQDGFDVVRQLGERPRPHIVFVTAYDEYAVKAFEVHAVDYLLKPFDPDRFYEAIDRVRSRRTNQAEGLYSDTLNRLLQELDAESARRDRIIVKSGGTTTSIPVTEIDWIESAGNYVSIHCGKKHHLLRETMNNLEHRLNPAGFARIHRQTIVNTDRIASLEAHFHGDQIVHLNDGKRLMLSRRYRKNLREFLT